MSTKSGLEKVVIVSTWPFGKAANEGAIESLKAGGNALDAAERGIWVPEDDPKNSSVGYGGNPNSEGVVELDAAIMWGVGRRAGSVAGLQNIRHPISVARKVMEDTKHVMLVGEGALKFALSSGFKQENLLTEESKKRWLEWKQQQEATRSKPVGHDTIGMVVLDRDGNIASGCSTSGAGFKLPGRVGDSPIIGSGLYADNNVGGAAATGLGEDIMRYCSCFVVVENMRAGMHPQEACLALLRWILEDDPIRNRNMGIGVVALNKRGEYGAAGMRKGFSYAVFANGENVVKEGGYIVEPD